MNIMELGLLVAWLIVAIYATLVIYLETHQHTRMYQYFPKVRGKTIKFCMSLITDFQLAGFLIYHDLWWLIAIMLLIDACMSLYGLYLIAQLLWYNR